MPTDETDENTRQQPLADADDKGTVKDLIEELDGIDTDNLEAKMNKTSISDNNGGRIELDEKKRRSTVVNMSEWIPAEAYEQWKKDHPDAQEDKV